MKRVRWCRSLMAGSISTTDGENLFFFNENYNPMKRLLYILFLFPLLLTGCELFDPPEPDEPNSSEEELPPVSFTGEGIFAMRVNGEVWKIGGFRDDLDGDFDPQSGRLQVYAQQGNETAIQFSLSERCYGPGTYSLYELKQHSSSVVFWPEWDGEFRTDSTHTGTLTLIRADDEYPYVLSGTFEFDAVNEAGEVVHITDGRFDFYYGR